MARSNQEVAGLLRERINDGSYPPGSRLPNRLALIQEFQSSTHTVQRALDQLVQEGYVTARKKAGSFVSENPPHLSRICVFLPGGADFARRGNRFYSAMLDELPIMAKRLNVSYELLDCMDEWRRQDRVQQLIEDVKLQRIAGILFMSLPWSFIGTPIYDEPGIARIAISAESRFGIPAVSPAGDQFYIRALEHLAAHGFRRPAVMVDTQTAGRETDPFIAWYQRFGLEFCTELIVPPAPGVSLSFDRILRLWHGMPESLRPDSLIINNDNCAAAATATLRELNWLCDSPGNVVVLANFPWTPEVHIPVTFLGFETDRMLEICTRNILAQGRGENVPRQTALPARFEYELTQ